MTIAYTMTRRVQFAETDMAGVLHFANFHRYMEEAEHAFWRSRGGCVLVHRDGGQISWPRVATSCEHFAPVRFEDEIELRLSVTAVGRRSVTFGVTFVKGGDRIAEGKMTAACCRTRPGHFESMDIPADLRRVLEAAAGRREAG